MEIIGGVAALMAYGLLAWVVWRHMQRSRESSVESLISRQQYRVLLSVSVLLLAKFITIKDVPLIIGQSGVLVLLGTFGFGRPESRNSSRPLSKGSEPTDKTAPPLPRSSGRRWRKRYAVLAVVLVSAGVGFGLHKLLSAPTTGKLKSDIPSATRRAVARQVIFTGQHFSFQHPDYFTQDQVDAARLPILEQYDFLRRGDAQAELAVQIEDLPSGNLTDSGSYRLRQVHPEQYVETIISVNGISVHIMQDTKSDANFAKVAFFQHEGKMASVALTGSVGNQNSGALDDTLAGVLNSWHWQ